MAREMFPVLKYRAIDYVCEASTRQKLKMNWLVLPVPYHLECSDLADRYPHIGALPEVSYRTPWTRGMVISTCKLVITGSILEDLMSTGEKVDFNEKFGFAPGFHGGNSVLVVTSSNPDSQCDLDADETLWLLDGLEKDTAVCRETFSKVTEELLCQKQSDILSLYLKEETLFTDHLLRFGGQLPQLRTMLGRLKTLSVHDPLLCPAREGLSEDLLFRHCLPFEETQEAGAELSGPGLAEDIWHVPRYVLQEESLALPMVLEPRKTGEQCRASSTRELRELFQLIPEEMDNISWQDVSLRKDEPARLWVSKEISDFQMADCPQENLLLKSLGFFMDITHPAHHRLYSQLETDVTLTPPRVRLTPPDRLSCVSTLPVEHMSPVYTHRLMSNSAREGLEEALWKAEKHLPAVRGLRLAEPQVPDSILLSWPALDTLKLMSSAADHNDLISRDPEDFPLSYGPVHSCSLVPEMWLGAQSEFVERMDYDDIESVPTFTENFLPLSFSQLDDMLGECGDDPGCSRQPITPAPIKANPTTSSVTDALGSSCQEIQKSNELIVIEQTATNQCRDPEPAGRASKSGTISSAQVKRDVCRSFTLKPVAQGVQSCCLVSSPEEDLDPLSSFMMLRSQPKPKVISSPKNYSCRGQSKPEPNVAIQPKEAVKPRSDQRTSKVISAARGNLVGVEEANSTARAETRVDSQVICVQASDTQRRAYRVLHAKAAPILRSALQQGLIAGAAVDFGSFPLDHTRFLLKQHEKQQSIGGNAHEKDVPLYQQVALIHLLVTARDLLLNCDLSTALDYLAGNKLTNMNAGTGDLWAELRILEYLSQRNMEPNPKLQELQEQMKAWVQKNSPLRLCLKALVIITFDCDSLKEMLVTTLSNCTGAAATATAVCPEEDCGKLDSWRVKESLQQCWCIVVCGQHIGPDFPWQCFSLAVEFDPLTPSSWAAVCRERGISHMSMRAMLPSCGEDPTDAQNQLIPFSLLITESVLNFHMLLQTLETTYNMTVLERDYPHSLKMLGRTSHYFVITVDESTAVLIQELDELSMKQSSENFILRMTALSLQYSCCWVIFYCPDGQGLGYRFSSEVFNNLVLIYSSFVLFGLKSENLDIKVLIVAEASSLAECIQRICHQALMSSGRDPVSWLDRDWLSVMPSEEEECLTMFPSISPLVAQLMLKRAPSLQWLLGATLPQHMKLLPEVPLKVMKLFSDTTALYKLNVSHSPLDSPAKATEGGASGPDSPWGFDTHDPCDVPESFGADHASPFDESSAYEIRSSAHVAHIADNDVLDRTDEVVDFMHYLGTAVSGNSFLRNSVGSQRGAYESRELGTGRLSLSNGPFWSVRETQISSIGTSLPQCRPPFRNGSASCPSGSSSCQPVPFGEGPAGQQPCYTPTTSRALPTSVGSQWKTSPFGHATRAVVSPCDYRLEALTHPDAESHPWNRPGQKRSAYAAELGEWRADVPRQKMGKLTYEKVSGRTDGQTRLIFF